VPDNLKCESLVLPEEFAKYDKQTDCILCMAYYGQCNALEGEQAYIGHFNLQKRLDSLWIVETVWMFKRE
jgi:succinate dehydrogenase / fumarate reductase iron-sulfur subunit